MSKQIHFSKFLNKLEEYENDHGKWCSKLLTVGRQTIESVSNNIDDKQLTNLTQSFMEFVTLLTQSKSNEKNTIKPSEV